MSSSSAAGTAALDSAERTGLRRLLLGHEPSDDVERADLGRIVDFAERHPNPFDRRIAEGHLTGSAFVLDPEGRVLLTHHRRLGIWIQLGGHSDGEREAWRVALREAREESGLPDLSFDERLRFDDGSPRLLDVDVHVIPARGPEPEHEHLDLRFVLRSGRPDEIVTDPRESKALEWVSIAEALRRGDPGMARALRKIGPAR